jgi:uncharacterized membrane protein YdbT with pleckstrin-like domain
MICAKCGTENPSGSIFCNRCGAAITSGGAQMTGGTANALAASQEREIFFVRPTLLFVKIGYGLAVAAGFLLVAILFQIGLLAGFSIASWLLVLVGLSLLLIPAFYHVRRNLIGYRLTDSKIEISKGLISQDTRNIPLRTIQDVGVTSTIFQRMLGFGNVVIDNASEVGGKVVLRNIDSPKQYADALLKQIRENERR